jgi:hypothetical protein
MKVVVTGGRDETRFSLVHEELDRFHKKCPITFLGEGGAPGIDTICRRWAFQKGIACATMHANWDFYYKAAGPIRNCWMLEFFDPDVVLRFPGGTGTANCAKQAETLGIEVIELTLGD